MIEILLGVAEGAIAVYVPSLCIDRFQIIRNRLIPNPESRGIVLSGHGYNLLDCANSALLCDRARIANFFTKRKIKLDWKDRATSGDLKEALNNPAYQSLALIGHSLRSCWVAYDKLVEIEDIEDSWNGEQKSGYWLQWGCGEAFGEPLGFRVMRDKDKIFGWTTLKNFFTRHNLEQLIYPNTENSSC